MTVRYLVLTHELREEFEKLEKLFQKILEGRKRYGDIEIYADAAAMNLQSYYSGIERIFRAITLKMEGDTPREKGGIMICSTKSASKCRISALRSFRNSCVSSSLSIFRFATLCETFIHTILTRSRWKSC